MIYNIAFLLNKLLATNAEYVKIIVDSTVFTKNGRARKQQYARPFKFFSYIPLKIHTPKFDIKKNITEPRKPKINKFCNFIFVLIPKNTKDINNKDK